MISVRPGADLDREKNKRFSLTIEAYDSPDDPSQSKSTYRTLFLDVIDINDNPPVFEPDRYPVRIPEDTNPGSIVVQLTATDPDTGTGRGLIYTIESGNPGGVFDIDRSTGRITVGRPLTDRAGVWNVTVKVCDGGQPPFCDDGLVVVTVTSRNNYPPEWVIPEDNDAEYSLLENFYVGAEVVEVDAIDRDKNKVTYYMNVNGDLVTSTKDFRINSITGMITAMRTFDREKEERYRLFVVAVDDGDPQMQSEIRTLIIKIDDVDDNPPSFNR